MSFREVRLKRTTRNPFSDIPGYGFLSAFGCFGMTFETRPPGRGGWSKNEFLDTCWGEYGYPPALNPSQSPLVRGTWGLIKAFSAVYKSAVLAFSTSTQ
jgi:hypothetical protein